MLYVEIGARSKRVAAVSFTVDYTGAVRHFIIGRGEGGWQREGSGTVCVCNVFRYQLFGVAMFTLRLRHGASVA